AYEAAAQHVDDYLVLLSDYERHTPNLADLDVHLTLGDLYTQAGRFGDAEPQYRRVLDEVDRYLNPRHRWRLDAREHLALMYAKAGDHDRARAAWKDYLAFAAKARGKAHAEYAWGLSNLADVER